MELAVLRALCRPGATRRSVAHELGISPYTVDAHTRHAFARLEVQSLA